MPQSGCAPRRGSACSYRCVPSKVASAQSSRGKWAGTQSRITPMPRWCRRSTKWRKSSGVAEARGRREVAGHLVAPRAGERMLHHRHQLDVREAEVGDVVGELVGELAVAQRAVALERVAPPRAEMHLVDRHRPAQRVGALRGARATPRRTRRASPRQTTRRVRRRHLGVEARAGRLQPQPAVVRPDLELVLRRPRRRRGRTAPRSRTRRASASGAGARPRR